MNEFTLRYIYPITVQVIDALKSKKGKHKIARSALKCFAYFQPSSVFVLSKMQNHRKRRPGPSQRHAAYVETVRQKII